MEKEVWRDIPEYEGLYQVSNYGNVKSLARNNCNVCLKDRILKYSKNHQGYKQVALFKKSKQKSFKIHKLVALAFIPNPNNYPCINHIDGNKQNNCVDNLEWCTYSHNNKEAFRLKLKKPINKGNFNEKSFNHKQVVQYDLQGNLIRIWGSLIQIKRELGYYCCPISNCCHKRKGFYTAYGYKWDFVNKGGKDE